MWSSRVEHFSNLYWSSSWISSDLPAMQISLTIQEDVDRAAYNEYMQCIVSRWWRTAFTHIPPVECVRKTHPDLVVMDIQSSCL